MVATCTTIPALFTIFRYPNIIEAWTRNPALRGRISCLRSTPATASTGAHGLATLGAAESPESSRSPHEVSRAVVGCAPGSFLCANFTNLIIAVTSRSVFKCLVGNPLPPPCPCWVTGAIVRCCVWFSCARVTQLHFPGARR